MFISPAWAHTATSGASTNGGATALSIILAVGVMLFLARLGHKRWRESRLDPHGGGK